MLPHTRETALTTYCHASKARGGGAHTERAGTAHTPPGSALRESGACIVNGLLLPAHRRAGVARLETRG